MKHCLEFLSQESLVVMEGQAFEFIDYKGCADLTMYKLSEGTAKIEKQ